MQKLYRFFFFLFLALFLLSTGYGALVSWSIVKIFQLSADKSTTISNIPLGELLELGLYLGLIFSFIQILFIILLLNRSVNHHRPYTMRNMLFTVLYFFIVTTVVFGIYIIYYLQSGILSRILLVLDGQSTLAAPLWLPFPLAWAVLFFVLAARIKKNA